MAVLIPIPSAGGAGGAAGGGGAGAALVAGSYVLLRLNREFGPSLGPFHETKGPSLFPESNSQKNARQNRVEDQNIRETNYLLNLLPEGARDPVGNVLSFFGIESGETNAERARKEAERQHNFSLIAQSGTLDPVTNAFTGPGWHPQGGNANVPNATMGTADAGSQSAYHTPTDRVPTVLDNLGLADGLTNMGMPEGAANQTVNILNTPSHYTDPGHAWGNLGTTHFHETPQEREQARADRVNRFDQIRNSGTLTPIQGGGPNVPNSFQLPTVGNYTPPPGFRPPDIGETSWNNRPTQGSYSPPDALEGDPNFGTPLDPSLRQPARRLRFDNPQAEQDYFNARHADELIHAARLGINQPGVDPTAPRWPVGPTPRRGGLLGGMRQPTQGSGTELTPIGSTPQPAQGPEPEPPAMMPGMGTELMGLPPILPALTPGTTPAPPSGAQPVQTPPNLSAPVLQQPIPGLLTYGPAPAFPGRGQRVGGAPPHTYPDNLGPNVPAPLPPQPRLRAQTPPPRLIQQPQPEPTDIHPLVQKPSKTPPVLRLRPLYDPLGAAPGEFQPDDIGRLTWANRGGRGNNLPPLPNIPQKMGSPDPVPPAQESQPTPPEQEPSPPQSGNRPINPSGLIKPSKRMSELSASEGLKTYPEADTLMRQFFVDQAAYDKKNMVPGDEDDDLAKAIEASIQTQKEEERERQRLGSIDREKVSIPQDNAQRRYQEALQAERNRQLEADPRSEGVIPRRIRTDAEEDERDLKEAIDLSMQVKQPERGPQRVQEKPEEKREVGVWGPEWYEMHGESYGAPIEDQPKEELLNVEKWEDEDNTPSVLEKIEKTIFDIETKINKEKSEDEIASPIVLEKSQIKDRKNISNNKKEYFLALQKKRESEYAERQKAKNLEMEEIGRQARTEQTVRERVAQIEKRINLIKSKERISLPSLEKERIEGDEMKKEDVRSRIAENISRNEHERKSREMEFSSAQKIALKKFNTEDIKNARLQEEAEIDRQIKERKEIELKKIEKEAAEKRKQEILQSEVGKLNPLARRTRGGIGKWLATWLGGDRRPQIRPSSQEEEEALQSAQQAPFDAIDKLAERREADLKKMNEDKLKKEVEERIQKEREQLKADALPKQQDRFGSFLKKISFVIRPRHVPQEILSKRLDMTEERIENEAERRAHENVQKEIQFVNRQIENKKKLLQYKKNIEDRKLKEKEGDADYFGKIDRHVERAKKIKADKVKSIEVKKNMERLEAEKKETDFQKELSGISREITEMIKLQNFSPEEEPETEEAIAARLGVSLPRDLEGEELQRQQDKFRRRQEKAKKNRDTIPVPAQRITYEAQGPIQPFEIEGPPETEDMMLARMGLPVPSPIGFDHRSEAQKKAAITQSKAKKRSLSPSSPPAIELANLNQIGPSQEEETEEAIMARLHLPDQIAHPEGFDRRSSAITIVRGRPPRSAPPAARPGGGDGGGGPPDGAPNPNGPAGAPRGRGNRRGKAIAAGLIAGGAAGVGLAIALSPPKKDSSSGEEASPSLPPRGNPAPPTLFDPGYQRQLVAPEEEQDRRWTIFMKQQNALSAKGKLIKQWRFTKRIAQ